MINLYNDISLKTSKLITNTYSTSFSLGIQSLHKDLHDSIYAVYGFVRLADEIVDSFHTQQQELLINEFEADTYKAIAQKISLNPVLNSFQIVVNKHNIDHELIKHFLMSMKMDLNKTEYAQTDYDTYIYGSAETVGLICLKIFCEGNDKEYNDLKYYAKQLGSSFQKINFLRDLKADYNDLNRVYFPNIDIENFDDATKKLIEEEIEIEFKEGLMGIKKLPKKAKFGVYLAYIYYYALFQKIKKLSAKSILNERIRISNPKKYILFIYSSIKYKLGLI
jgi:phytoene synthase